MKTGRLQFSLNALLVWIAFCAVLAGLGGYHLRTVAALRQEAEIIDAVLELGGRYYLPYRLHATVEQFYRAYPQAGRFFELKRRYDPDEIFQNQFYLKYGRP